MPRPNTIADFWGYVNKTDDCWLWTGNRCGREPKYGAFGINGQQHRAHRFSWKLHNGSIPDGLHVLHECDVHLCVRPSHLFLGTHNDNMADMAKKNRAAKNSGSNHVSAKLTEQQVLEIRKLYKDGNRQLDLAECFGVSQGMISKIILRKKWTHI